MNYRQTDFRDLCKVKFVHSTLIVITVFFEQQNNYWRPDACKNTVIRERLHRRSLFVNIDVCSESVDVLCVVLLNADIAEAQGKYC